MHEDHPILQLYQEDRRALFCERRLEEIPRALDALRKEALVRKEGQDRRLQELGELEESMRHLERDAQYQREKLKGRQDQQMKVTTLDGMRAGEHEIEGLQKSIAGLEERVFEKMESQEILQREIQLRESAEIDETERLRREAEELEVELRECQHEREKAGLQRERLLGEMDEALARRYQRIFQNQSYATLAPLRDGACSGCGEKLPPQQALEVRKAGRVETCQGCGRLVMWVEQ